MKLLKGDVVSGKGVRLGRYVGLEVIDDCTYHQIFDINKNVNYFVPEDKVDSLRKLPAKDTAEKNLLIFDHIELLDIGEVEGSRYKYFKQKLEEVDFEKKLEVLHDLSALKVTREINSSERKLLTGLKEEMIDEIAFILETDIKELEDLIDLKKFSIELHG